MTSNELSFSLAPSPSGVAVMCSPRMPLLCDLCCTLLLGLPRPSSAQIVDAKELAKARFEASQVTLHDLGRERLQAAQTEWQVPLLVLWLRRG